MDSAEIYMRRMSAAARVKIFSLPVMKESGRLPPASDVLKPKNDITSMQARKTGNDFFMKDKNYVSALEQYNRSICLATDKSENLGIAYANRSAVYLKSGFYKYCLQNIELALENNYPETWKPKLMKRKEECLEIMNNHEDGLEKYTKHKMEVKLSYPAKERMPNVIDGLEYVVSPNKYGRHLRAKRDLYPGDVIIIDQPFTKCVKGEAAYKRCANCLIDNHLNLLPCRHCTLAMFCSENCREIAWKRFHKYECKIIDEIFSSIYLDAALIAIRATLNAFTMFDDPEELQNLINDIDVEKENPFDLDYTCLTEEQHFRAIYSHSADESLLNVDQLTKESNFCAMIWHLLSTYTELKLILKTKDLEDFFINTLHRFLLIHHRYTHALGTSLFDYREKFGKGLFAIAGLLNHSCVPNTERVSDSNKNVTIVIRVIKKGEQIFDNYGTSYLYYTLIERQNFLKKGYYFNCECEACAGDYRVEQESSLQWIKDAVQIEHYNIEYTKRKFKEYKKYLKDNHKNYRSFEYRQSQIVLRVSFFVLFFDRILLQQLKPLDG